MPPRPPNPDDAAQPVDPEIARQAAAWLAKQDRGLTTGEQRNFSAWRRSAPDHAREFDRIERAWLAADVAKADPGLVALAQQLDIKTLAALSNRRGRQRRRAALAWACGIAATAVLAFWSWPGNQGAPAVSLPPAAVALASGVELQPSTAEPLTLPDGSMVHLRTGSLVEPRYTQTGRRVILSRGEAQFTVQKDAARPFLVEAGGLAVRAVGTAFNVRLDESSVEVIVTEGAISLHAVARAGGEIIPAQPGSTAPSLLTAGQRVTIKLSPARVADLAQLDIATSLPSEVEQALSWQGARLVLNRASLADAMVAFNRQGRSRFELADSALVTRQVSGTFRAENGEALVRLLEQAGEIRAERRTDGTITLHAAR